MLGKGIAINPTEGKVVSPFEGKVTSLLSSKHAIGLTSNETGAEILIHVGLDTVELNGQYFEAKVEQDQQVHKGEELLTFDIKKIQEAGYKTQVSIVVTNSGEFSEFDVTEQETIAFSDELITLKK